MNATIHRLPMILVKPKLIFRYDRRNRGLTLVENVEFGSDEFVLRFDEFLKKGEDSVKGTVMLARAKDMGKLAGQLHAERLEREEEKKIPKELLDFKLLFPGTIWGDDKSASPNDDLWIPYFFYDSYRHSDIFPSGPGWTVNFAHLAGNFDSTYRIARLCQ